MELESLVRKRGAIKAKTTCFANFIAKLESNHPDKISDEDVLIELDLRLERALLVIDEFESVQLEIEMLTTNPEEQAVERGNYLSNFYGITSKAKRILLANKAIDQIIPIPHSTSGPSTPIEDCRNSQNVRLPVIDLPKFDGNYDTWLEFHDTFLSLIHKNTAINDIQKFHYLRSSLIGGAKQVIGSLEISSANYSISWDLLCERYNNTRILVQNHVNALFNISKIHDESSFALRKLIDNLSKHLRALSSLNEPTNNWDTLIIHLVTTKLDSTTNREWEQKKASFTKPVLKNLTDFLKDRADLLESIENHSSRKCVSKKPVVKTMFTTNTKRCPFCNNEHYIQACPSFLSLNVTDRIVNIKKLKLCLNCLRQGHMLGTCKSSSCQKCKLRHNTLLHIEQKTNDNIPQISTAPEKSISLTTHQTQANSQVLLSTVLIQAFDISSQTHTVRALLDPGSQSSFITENLCKSLQLRRKSCNTTISCINNNQTIINHSTTVTVQSRYNNYSTKITCLIVPSITATLPSFEVDITKLDIPSNIKLADPRFHIPDKIDILLGADCFWNLMCVGQIKLNPRGPIIQNTRFGWIVAGPMQTHNSANSTLCNFLQSSESDKQDKQLSRFWEIETFPDTVPRSPIEQQCEELFLKTVKRDTTGKFVVTIPFKEPPEILGNSFDTAEKRFFSLERKLEKLPNFKAKYVSFINEYLELGHMVKVLDKDQAPCSYYMPHHGVCNENSTTTKLRVVFDASCRTTSGYSLNDIQMVGPTIQPDLFTTLLRHRKYNYVIGADIEKMYRMCLVNPEQTALQRILWRDKPTDMLGVYELVTVTYGTASASYLAIRSLYQLGLDCKDPQISEIIKSHFYVDDLLTGSNSISEAIYIANEVSRILSTGGFNLRKWVSNSPKIIQGIHNADTVDVIDMGTNENTRTLGLLWNSRLDSFTYKITELDSSVVRVTKRSILSEVSQIFDPLGLITPVIIRGKILLQELWSEGIGWDDSLPNHLYTKWLQFRDELCILSNIKIPRQVTCKHPVHFELHGFSDSSSYAYGACVYLKSIDKNNEVQVRLVCAKSRVAPLKIQTIPRLELIAALLLARLMQRVKGSLELKINKEVYWTDSTIVLSWLNISPSNLQVFVANRVAALQELTNVKDWRHVPTNDNPADCVSRGIKSEQLLKLGLYWHGPDWIKSKCEDDYPPRLGNNESVPEMRKQLVCHKLTIHDPFIQIKDFSNLTSLKRTIAYCLRFKDNSSKPMNDRYFGPLTTVEIDKAFVKLIKLAQAECFDLEIQALKNKEILNPKNKLLKLAPFLDNDEILRVGGRLTNSNYSFNKKFPILLPARHHLTYLIFLEEHKMLLHAGPQHLLCSIRDKFWPLRGRNLARKIVHQCIKCFRANPSGINPIMGNLPKTRINPAPPFNTTGVDYAGPYSLKSKSGRGGKIEKCYIGLFICFATRAIHLELITDLTKDAFIAALRRFVGRRGKPAQMWSDNGTCFVGADRELKELGNFLLTNSSFLSNSIENDGIPWSFIPASSPHFGGLWEAGIKSTKYHLKRVARNSLLTYEQFSTLLIQIEATLNSRPLTQLSPDPNDFTPLTPSHFLIGRPLTAVADPNLTELPVNRLSHYQRIQQLQQHFWARWSREYISELQQRSKWTTQHGSLKLDDLVVIKEDNQPPLKWCLGRILKLHYGSDGIARVATIKTQTSIIRRAFAKICPLPKNGEENSV